MTKGSILVVLFGNQVLNFKVVYFVNTAVYWIREALYAVDEEEEM